MIKSPISRGGNKFVFLFILLIAAVFAFACFSKPMLTSAVMMESGEILSYEPVFIVIAIIIILALFGILWWWFKKK